MTSHHSQSGPVKVIARFPASPATTSEIKRRLLHKLALIEDRIADRQTYASTGRGRNWSTGQLDTLLKQREDTILRLSSFGE